jgi:hypothetical protein
MRRTRKKEGVESMLGTKPRRKYPDPDEVARQINEEFYAEQRKLALEKKRRELTGESEPEEKIEPKIETQQTISSATLKDVQEFYANNIPDAMQNCINAGQRMLFAPEIAELRIAAGPKHMIITKWWTTASLIATGWSRQNKAVVVFAHVPHYFSDPQNVRNVLKNLVEGAGELSKSEFLRLLDLEDSKKVFVVDYSTLIKAGSSTFAVSKALAHPQTIPFIGGEELAQKYLEKHKQVYGDNISIYYWKNDSRKNQYLGRLLFFGSSCYGNLSGSFNLDNLGRLCGVNQSRA